MLNIPETVKALFKQDGVFKNFRCRFPNGELPDITNADIVRESVKFQESICSHDVFKFGLSEASVIEFETVGVANMYGMTIECSSEIDCSSLSAEEIAEIEAGTWDGEFIALADSDLGFPFFRVPYGVFYVDSCPRDHQAMSHRKVTAYSASGVSFPTIEALKLNSHFPVKAYTPNAKDLFYSFFAEHDDGLLLGAGYTKEQYIPEGVNINPVWNVSFSLPLIGGGTLERTINVRSAENPRLYLNASGLLGVTLGRATSVYQQILNYFAQFDIDYESLGFNSLGECLLSRAQQSGLPLLPIIRYTVEQAMPGWQRTEFIYLTNDLPVFYPSGFQGLSKRNGLGFHYLSGARIQHAEGGTIVIDATITEDSSAPELTFWQYVDANPLNISLAFDATGETGPSALKYSYASAYDPLYTIGGMLEAFAMFAKPSRAGTVQLFRISDSSPIAVTPGEYSQMWFDEYDVQPIGVIRYAYIDDANETQVVDYQFGEGASVYDMSDNEFLKLIVGVDRTVIESLLDIYFVPYLASINFTPIDLAAKGLPYFEAGDALSVTAQDGIVCNSYVLRRELDGVQVLTDQIDSQSGLIIDSGEGV